MPFNLSLVAQRRNSLERAWFAAVIVWSILRVVFADVYFVKYGVNIWIFAAVEAVSAPFLAVSSTKMLVFLIEHRLKPSLFWGLLTLVSFGSPDVYLLSAGKNLPWLAYFVVIAVMSIAGTVSALQLRRRARLLRPIT